jgi:methyl-accepting chemotaxis protein
MRGLRRTRVAIFLAGRSLVRGNAGVSLMSIAMMTAVFISVMFLPSLLSGAIDALNHQLVGTLTGDLSITPSGGVAIPDSTAYLAQIRATDGVAAATGIRQVGNQISHGSEEVAQAVNAIDPESYAEVFTTPEHLVEGTYLQPDDTEGILLGIGVAGADQERQRTYSISLKTVHAGDTVEVALAGGQTHTFIVRGIYENDFPLSDQGAYITLAAADALIPGTSIVDTLQQTFDALDAVTSAVGEAADQADTLAEVADGVASAMGSLASSARSLAASAAEVGSGADELAASARRTASSAASLADAGRALADSMARAEDAVGPPRWPAPPTAHSRPAGSRRTRPASR